VAREDVFALASTPWGTPAQRPLAAKALARRWTSSNVIVVVVAGCSRPLAAGCQRFGVPPSY